MQIVPQMRTVRADLQCYLKSRSDTDTLDYCKVYDEANERLGPGGIIGITNFHDFRWERARQATLEQDIAVTSSGNAFHVPAYGLLVVKCQRIMTQQGDIDAIGVQEGRVIPERRSLEETLERIRDEGALVNIPAPFHKRGLGPYLKEYPDLLEQIHALTVYSGEGAFWIPFLIPRGGKQSPNEQALTYYQSIKQQHPHLGAVTASNSSTIEDIGTNYTLLSVSYDYKTLTKSGDVTAMLSRAFKEATPFAASQQPLLFSAMKHQAKVILDNKIPLLSRFIREYSSLNQAHAEFEEALKRQE